MTSAPPGSAAIVIVHIVARTFTSAAAIVPLASSGGHYGVMVKLRRALVVLPSDFSEEPGGYIAACQTLGLTPSSHGYAIYLVEGSAGSLMAVCAELGGTGVIRDTGRGRAGLHGAQQTGYQPGQRLPLSRGELRDFSRGKLSVFCRSGQAAAQHGRDLTDHPSVRVVINASDGKLEGVGVLNPVLAKSPAKPYAVEKPTERCGRRSARLLPTIWLRNSLT